ncbi:response regulator transcription factor [Agarivorans sp. Z349TD_8]|uniref:response regulator transcription factor n=1 Tax=Agarivorans sp. Z349TD_8 TaxID=3421434 RepID=UPI003D7D7EA8
MSREESKGIILVVDDATESLAMLNTALVSQGYTVLVAMDGLQALNIAARMVPDVVLMDALMPNMDGFEACLLLKQNKQLSDVPVIFMTGLSDSESVVKGLESGGVDYIQKPIKLEELFARIKVHLGNSRLTRSAHSVLEEIAQATFTFNLNSHIVWASSKAKDLLQSAGITASLESPKLNQQLADWLSSMPDKHSLLTIHQLNMSLKIRYLGESAPGEHLLRIINDDDVSVRESLRQRFKLTERESEVLLWLTRGKTNREIAQILSMSPRTVNKHLEPIFQKLAVENRTTAAAICLEYLNQR